MAEPVQPTAASIGKSLEDVLAEARSLREDVNAAERARRRENYIGLMLIGMLALFVLLIATVTWQNNRIAQDTRRTNDRMADCTTPGGRCYEDGKARTGAAVGDIVKASIYMAECSRLHPGESGPAFDAELEQCVAGKLAHPAPLPTPQPTPTR